jgi:hypothetical protein
MTNPLQAQYDALVGNPASAAKLMSGDPGMVRMFQDLGAQLHGLPPSPAPTDAATDLAKPGEFDPTAPDARLHVPDFEGIANGEISRSEQIRHVEALREAYGINDVQIREMMTGIDSRTGRPFTQAAREQAALVLGRNLSDPVFAERAATRGTPEAARVLLLNGIVATGVVG